MLAHITSAIASLFDVDLNWVAVILPIILGSLLVVPIYLIGLNYSGHVMGIVAAAIAVLFPYYVQRTGLGFFDTDSLIVVFTFYLSALAMRYGGSIVQRDLSVLLQYLVITLLFYWWWDQAPQVVTVIALVPMLIALVARKRAGAPPLLHSYKTLLFAIVCVMAVLAMLAAQWMGVFDRMLATFYYISKQSVSVFPMIGSTVGEQQAVTIDHFMYWTSSLKAILFLSAVGLAMLLQHRSWRTLYLLVPVILGGFSFLYAERFLIFLGPVMSLGVGYIVALVWEHRSHWIYRSLITLTVLITLFSFGLTKLERPRWPVFNTDYLQVIRDIPQHTEKNAVIWALWGYGYPINYLAHRTTVADGSAHDGELTFYNALPLATNNQRLSSNFIRFYASQGVSGMHQFYQWFDGNIPLAIKTLETILAADASNAIVSIRDLPFYSQLTHADWMAYFFPVMEIPIYIYMDMDSMNRSRGWYGFGNWNFDQQEGNNSSHFLFSKTDFSQMAMGEGQIAVSNLLGKTITINNTTLPINRGFYLHNGQQFSGETGFSEEGGVIYYNDDLDWVSIISTNLFDSVAGKMVYGRRLNSDYFTLIQHYPDSAALYRVQFVTYETEPPALR